MEDRRPHSDSSSESSEEDIEMANLEDIVVTPNPRLNGTTKNSRYLEELDDEDSEHDGDDGNVALLGEGRPRGRERSPRPPPKVWPQVRNIVIESAPTLLFTTIGLLFTGELLDHVSRWRAMKQVDELIMIIPVILNLMGNLEMNLSARLSTAANVGELDLPDTRRSIIGGNLALLQVQATAVSFIAACVSLLLGLVVPNVVPTAPKGGAVAPQFGLRRPRPPIPTFEQPSGLSEFVMVASTAMTAACLSSLLLGSFMCGLIVLCRRVGRDPDNIAPPIAACLGDLLTLCLLGGLSSMLIRFIHTPIPLALAILIVLSTVSCFVFTHRNPHVSALLKQGWPPLFGAMIISSCTGIVLDLFVSRYDGFALLAVVISGLPGSVGSIFVSRLSTALHAAALRVSSLPTHSAEDREPPSPRLVAITLLIVTLPVEIIFLSVLHFLGWIQLPFVFVALSVVFFCCAVSISLLFARFLTNFLWSKNLDPDMYALPVHSALMDLIGQLLLVVCFEIVSVLGFRLKLKTG